MPSSIPYDHPSLVLGNIVDTRVIDLLKKISTQQTKIDSAQGKMNSLIMMKRSLSMTINELVDMSVDIADLNDKIGELDKSITQAATEYMTVRMQCETEIQRMNGEIGVLDSDDTMESPVDFSRSTIKRLPLSSESMKLDAQYFSFGSNQENDTVANIEKYVRESTSNMGAKSNDIAKTASSQINQQRQNHSLAGTLILTASCTHRNVAIFDPFVIDADKAISAWNSVYGDGEDRINTDDIVAMSNAQPNGKEDEKSLTAVSGVCYGSSFLGMVHILNSENTSIGDTDMLADKLQGKLKMGGWLENASGGFGVNSAVMDDVKKMLSTQSISSHVSIIVMGAVPSIASSNLKMGVSKLLQPDSEKLSMHISALSQSASKKETVESGSSAAKEVNGIIRIQNSTAENVIRSLSSIDQGSNKVLDINSMMSAFESYIQNIRSKDDSAGVPVNFYLKKITRAQLMKLWMDKYYQEKEESKGKPKPLDSDAN